MMTVVVYISVGGVGDVFRCFYCCCLFVDFVFHKFCPFFISLKVPDYM